MSKTCKDCLYYECCKSLSKDFIKHPKDYENNEKMSEICITFKDRSKFVELPCKIGDTVYFIKAAFNYLPVPKAEKIRKIELLYDNIVLFRTENRSFESKRIGETVFLTREEAEQALREMN